MSDPRTKVRNLLIKARHAGTPTHEAELSRTVAARLANKYNLDLARIEAELEAPQQATASRNSNVYCVRCHAAMATVQGYCMSCAFDVLFNPQPQWEGPYYGEAGFYSDPSTSYGPRPRARRPRTEAPADGTPKARIDHSACDHESTPAARAKCRRARARNA